MFRTQETLGNAAICYPREGGRIRTNILAVDDERASLTLLKSAILEALPSAQLCAVMDVQSALSAAAETPFDVAFLDIQLRELSGLSLAKTLREINANTNIVFVSGYSQYMADAFALYASGYVMKPVDAERIRQELLHLRTPAAATPRHRVRIQCFGNFEAYADEKAIPFTRKKSKELLAYLVDRQGASVSLPEAAGILFEDGQYSRSRQRQLQYIITDMLHALAAVQAQNVVLRQRSMLSIDPAQFDCDLFAFLLGDTRAVNAYRGEYMVQYSWAEFSFRAAPVE